MDVEWIKNEIKKETRNSLRKAIESTKGIAKEKALTHRRKITAEWFEGFDFQNRQITKVKPPIVKYTGDSSADLVIETYIEESEYVPKPEYERWARAHGGGSSSEWILQTLQLERGIIGLPAYASTYERENGKPYNGAGWSDGYNLHYHESWTGMGLDKWIQLESNWSSYMNEIENLLNSKWG